MKLQRTPGIITKEELEAQIEEIKKEIEKIKEDLKAEKEAQEKLK